METKISVLGGMFDSTSVVETVEGFPRGDKAVDSSFFAQMLRCFFTDGIIRPTEGTMEVGPGDGLTLTVAAGCGWILGKMAWLTEPVSLPVEAGHKYRVVLCLDRKNDGFRLESREDVTDLRRTEVLWDLVLADVDIPADAAAVTADMITDCRMDESLCGAVNSPVDALQAVAFAANSHLIGGLSAEELVPRSGCQMNGNLIAAGETSGMAVLRNIRYGTSLPNTVKDGEIFILLEEM